MGYAQFIVIVLETTCFAFTLGLNSPYAVYGGIIVILGICMFIFQMMKTIIKQEKKGIITYYVIGAMICLLLTIIAGFFLVWNIAFTTNLNQHTLLYSHIVFCVAGWFTLLIFGFSYKLVQILSLSHGFSMIWVKYAFATYISGLVIIITSFWLQAEYIQIIGWFLLFVGFSLFLLDIKEILEKRIKNG